MATTVAVVSDTHAFLDPRIIELIRECDIAIHAGDICGADILESMQPKTGKVIAVTGNNDPYCHITNKKLPEVLSIDLPGGKITVEHGHAHGAHQPCHDSLRTTHADAKVIIYGHTHKQVIDKSANPWVVNPGAAGNTRNHGGPSCLVITCSENKEWEIEQHRFSENQSSI